MKFACFLAFFAMLCRGARIEGNNDQQHEFGDHAKAYSRSIRDKFERSFHDKCSKYHFVDKWVQSLEGGMDRNYYTFMFQENGLKNGGLGYRLG